MKTEATGFLVSERLESEATFVTVREITVALDIPASWDCRSQRLAEGL